jgi:hypothetical protein
MKMCVQDYSAGHRFLAVPRMGASTVSGVHQGEGCIHTEIPSIFACFRLVSSPYSLACGRELARMFLSCRFSKVVVYIQIILAMLISWLVCVILTETNVFSSDPRQPSYSARTDMRLDAVTSSPWIRLPYPCTFLVTLILRSNALLFPF